MDVKVLGPGCRNCETLERHTREALEQLGIEASIEKVTDPVEIVGHGVMATPALLVDGELVTSGKVPNVRRLVRLLGG